MSRVATETAWLGGVEVDEHWLEEWVKFGMTELGTYLYKQAKFAAWCKRNGRP